MLLSNFPTSSRPSVQSRSSDSSFSALPDVYADSRTHGPQGLTRAVRLPKATSSGGGAIARSEDGSRCVVAGRESLRILRISGPEIGDNAGTTEHRLAVGKGGHYIEASRNLWAGSGLHIDSAITDVAWGHGTFDSKILTSARNGELIMWDLNKPTISKYERRTRDHSRSIHALSYSPILKYYCLTGSADGDLRVWDLRDLSKSIMWIRHPASVRAVIFSPVSWQPLQAITALDNGSIYRWDLKVGQRGQIDRIPAAHSGPVIGLDWLSLSTSSSGNARHSNQSNWYGSSSSAPGLLDDMMPGSGGMSGSGAGDIDGTGAGWLASGGLDRCVKVWDLSVPATRSHISHQPVYTLRTSFPVRRVLWRPGYECELAVVSNADSGAGSGTDMLAPNANPTLVPGVSAGAGIFSALSSPRVGNATLKLSDSAGHTDEEAQVVSGNGMSDPVEIWDVRRGFIAKWTVNESAVEGGVTDAVFADSHALWAQHTSGMFSQLDLRSCSKPLDAIPRVAVTWDAAGFLAFVTDRPKQWEMPYDDLKPEKGRNLHERQGNVKALGQSSYAPVTQSIGTVLYEERDEDLENFVKLAQGYVIEGTDKTSICAHNSKVSLEAGNVEAARTWSLLETLLTDLMPDVLQSPTPVSARELAPGLSHSVSAPAALPTLNSLTPSISSHPDVFIKSKNKSPGSRSKNSDERPGPSNHQSPQKITPTSSATSSPHGMTNSLPQLPGTVLARRDSAAVHSLPNRPRVLSSSRRPSFTNSSIYSTHSDSPNDSIRSHTSLRLYGEGALDDSDSSESDDEDKVPSHSTSRRDSDEEEISRLTPVSPSFHPRAGNPAHPSPLSQLVGQQSWTEDERDEDDSPSPASTSGSNSSDTSPARKVSRSTRRKSAQSRTRSRSSTVASLAVSSSHRTLIKQESYSSIRTVIAINAPGTDHSQDGQLHRDDTVRDLRNRPSSIKASPNHHHRAGSVGLSSEFFLDPDKYGELDAAASLSSAKTNAEYAKSIQDAEFAYRELGWEALRKSFESFAELGDVQVCAFLSIIAPKELKVSRARKLRFVESYVDILSRLRLHTSAAYLRKYVEEEEIRSITALQTTIYTSCSRCCKSIIAPTIGASSSGKPSGSYAYCPSCRKASTMCSICHLPVRALLFKCPVCMHGGHQECYREYYMRRPMVELKTPSSPEYLHRHLSVASTPDPSTIPLRRGRAVSRSGSMSGADSDGGSEDSPASLGDAINFEVMASMGRTLHGHPCAAGCGHFCWAANKQALVN